VKGSIGSEPKRKNDNLPSQSTDRPNGQSARTQPMILVACEQSFLWVKWVVAAMAPMLWRRGGEAARLVGAAAPPLATADRRSAAPDLY